ncbi:MAG: hypothetical protein K2G21_09495, partial [Muribaculaceae bacterium]|nr:hypothetical protein [Muribaculaceae bacterium]
ATAIGVIPASNSLTLPSGKVILIITLYKTVFQSIATYKHGNQTFYRAKLAFFLQSFNIQLKYF